MQIFVTQTLLSSRHMSVVLLSSGGQMFMISGTLILPSSLTVMVAKNWREQEIYLNKPWMVALPSLPKVSRYKY